MIQAEELVGGEWAEFYGRERSAHASLYTVGADYSSSPVLIGGGESFSPTVTFSPGFGSGLQITSVQLILTFANGDFLDGSTFQGHVVLGTGSPSYINFFPTVTGTSGGLFRL